MKYGTYFYVVILCQVYKSSVIFNTITTSFKKSRKNINYIYKQSRTFWKRQHSSGVARGWGNGGKPPRAALLGWAAKLDWHLKFGWRKIYWENFLGQRKKKWWAKKDHQKNLGKMSKKHELMAKRFENNHKWINLNTFWKILAHGVRGKIWIGRQN